MNLKIFIALNNSVDNMVTKTFGILADLSITDCHLLIWLISVSPVTEMTDNPLDRPQEKERSKETSAYPFS